MAKSIGHASDGDAAFENHSRTGGKRSHQWFVNASESEISSSKKQTVEAPIGKSSSEISNANVPPWEYNSSFSSVPNHFIDRLFESETERSIDFGERNISHVETDNMRLKGLQDQFGGDASVSLSISHAIEDPESRFTFGEIRKVEVDEVKDNECMHDPEHSFHTENNGVICTVGQDYSNQNDTNFISIGQDYDKDYTDVTLMGHSYSSGDALVRSTGPTYSKEDNNPLSLGIVYDKEDPNIISFSAFHDEQDMIPVAQTISSYIPSHQQPSVHMPGKEELQTSNEMTMANATRVAKPIKESISKSKPDMKTSRKEAPNSFPSNVRSLISTGMLDGVPVKYVSLSREELRGVIKGSGYLCACDSCNYSKVLNAYEFERHAGCKTKHPNNHIYFENGKTIYQIVQELRSTPESMLFDAIQTVFGAPINQKSFRSWKESFQAATRELQRIYGKEELNL